MNRRKIMLTTVVALVSAPLALNLYVQKREIKTGEDFAFSVMVKNKAATDTMLVGLLDGGEAGRRGPSARFEVKANGKWEPLKYNLVGCGNTNPLTQESFFTIPAGKNGTLLKGQGWFPPSHYSQLGKPGRYEVRFVYDTTIPFERWIGGPLLEEAKKKRMAELQDEYDRVPKGVFTTSPVVVNVS